MILVDTSIWIELLNGRLGESVSDDDLLTFATCGPVIQEVLQGVREGPNRQTFRESMLALPRLADPLPVSLFDRAASLYQDGRRRGYTIRSSTDCLIAAIAIENGVPVWHRDRDFRQIAAFAPLLVLERLPALASPASG